MAAALLMCLYNITCVIFQCQLGFYQYYIMVETRKTCEKCVCTLLIAHYKNNDKTMWRLHRYVCMYDVHIYIHMYAFFRSVQMEFPVHLKLFYYKGISRTNIAERYWMLLLYSLSGNSFLNDSPLRYVECLSWIGSAKRYVLPRFARSNCNFLAKTCNT